MPDPRAPQRLEQHKSVDIDPVMRDGFADYLRAQQFAAGPFPQSSQVVNPDTTPEREKLYYDANALPGYVHLISESSPEKMGFWEPDQANLGHKLHLNVTLGDVRAVSEYLRSRGYCHKYLSGGDVDEGKIFTLYIGDKSLASQLARELSQDLQRYLCRPEVTSEVEYAPNVVGRFTAHQNIFAGGGFGFLRGMPLLNTDWKRYRGVQLSEMEPEKRNGFINALFERSYGELANSYGTFFYGKSE